MNMEILGCCFCDTRDGLGDGKNGIDQEIRACFRNSNLKEKKRLIRIMPLSILSTIWHK